MKDPIEVVVLGLGNMGRNHLRVIEDDPRFVIKALVEPHFDPERMRSKQSYPMLPSYLHLDTIRFDAAVVATPTQTHFEVVRYLLEHDKHVLVEKPAASTPGEVAWLVKLAQSRGLKLGVGHIERCNPAVAKAEQLIAAGAIGRPLFGTSTRAGAFPANVAEGNDVILDLGIHEMDVLNRLFGPLKVVGGRGRDVQITGITDIADAWVEGRDGFFAAIHVDWHTPARIRTLRIVGERGILDLDYRQQTVSIDGGPPVELDKLEPLRLQLDRFYHFLMQSASDLCSGDEMTLSAQLLQDWSKLAGGA